MVAKICHSLNSFFLSPFAKLKAKRFGRADTVSKRVLMRGKWLENSTQLSLTSKDWGQETVHGQDLPCHHLQGPGSISAVS